MRADLVLALVGGGHAHVEIIRSFRAAPIPGVRLRVFDPNRKVIYSGMVPGFVAGQYLRDEVEIDLVALCAHEQIEFVPRAVLRIDANARRLYLAGPAADAAGDGESYDAASLDVGASVAGADLPGVREFALASRPIDGLVSRIDALLSRASGARDGPLRVNVVGAGAGGVELAFCAHARLARAAKSAAGDFEVALVTSDASALQNSPPALRRAVERALEHRGIRTLANSAVRAVRRDAIELTNGGALASDAVLWVTGPAAHPLAADSGLACDPQGFARVRPTLQVEGRDELFAVGDCASLPGMKKAGVYSVRAAPVLDQNLRAHFAGSELRAYAPQSDFLSLLNLGDGTAIAAKWGLAIGGRVAMRAKDRIDRAFVRKYR